MGDENQTDIGARYAEMHARADRLRAARLAKGAAVFFAAAIVAALMAHLLGDLGARASANAAAASEFACRAC